MLLDPMGAPPKRSPTLGIGVQSTTVVFKKVRDVAYADTNNGEFAMLARPDPARPQIEYKLVPRHPLAGYADLVVHGSATFSEEQVAPGDMSNGVFLCDEADLGFASRVLGGRRGIPLEIPESTNFTVTLQNRHGSHTRRIKVLVHQVQADNWVGLATMVVPGSATLSHVFTTNAGQDVDLVEFKLVNQDGDAIVPTNTQSFNTSVTCATMAISASAQGSLVGEFVSNDLVHQGQVSHARVTAMSQLVTDMSPSLVSQGNAVAGLVKSTVVDSAVSVPKLMDICEALNEPGRVQTAPNADGSRVFYTPDDEESYEPKDFGETRGDDNVIIFATKLVDGMSIRIITTWVVEFYSPKQLFTKKLTPTWGPEYRAAMRYLKACPAVSCNPDHKAFIAKVAKGLGTGIRWALDHSSEIATLGQLLAQVL
jgi:hypothetical protein